jgi:hypothetical protein
MKTAELAAPAMNIAKCNIARMPPADAGLYGENA